MIGLVLLAVIVAVIVMVARKRGEASSPYGLAPQPGGGDAMATRSPLQDKLDDWVAAELIDSEQADAILAHEVASAPPVRTSRVPLAAEAVGYIGSGLVLAAAALLVGNRWEDMSTPARVASLAAPTILALVAGWWTGRSDEPALQRLGSVLWLLAVVGVAGVAAEVWVDAIHDGDPPDHHAALFVGSITLLAAAPTWWVRRVELQQLALFGATIATSVGIVDTVAGARDRDLSALSVGLVLVTLGAIWVSASLTRMLPPALLGNVLGSALILIAAQIVRADNDQAGLWLGLVASIMLMATGVARSELEILFVGTAGLFQWTPQIALHYLEDTLGAEATLFVIGTLLIVLAGVFTRLYPKVKDRLRDRASQPGETSAKSDKHSPPPGGGGLYGLPFVLGAAAIAFVLVALIGQAFEESSDSGGPSGSDQDDRGPVEEEQWRIALDGEGEGIYSVFMLKTFRPLEEAEIEDLGGRLVWEETEIELCAIGIRSVGDGFVQIGDIFQPTEDGCNEIGEAFEEFGPPETACVYVRAKGIDDEHCAPLTVD